MRVLVTGASGRIGHYAVGELTRAGHRAIGIDIAPERARGRVMRVDLTDSGQVYQALAGAEAVVHMGAWASAGIVPDTRTYADNATGTFNLFQACADLGIRRIVSASSAQVYGFSGDPPLHLPADESHPLRPLNCYALSKVAGEQAAEYFASRRDLEILSFRIMGARAPDEMGANIEQVVRDPGSGRGLLWTRVDARDVALAARLAIEAPAVESGPYNITGTEILLEEKSADLVQRHCGAATEIRAGLEGRNSPLSCARAARVFGYQPRFPWSVSQRHPEQ